LRRYSRRRHFEELQRVIREVERSYGLGHPLAAKRQFEAARELIDQIILREPVRTPRPRGPQTQLPGAN